MNAFLQTNPRKPGRRRPARTNDHGWQLSLPAEWRTMAVVPLDFQVYREYEIAAERIVGQDEDGRPCFITYTYQLTEPRSEDGEGFYLETVYGEAVSAWKLKDERWLIRRVVVQGEPLSHGRAFYSFSERMPR